MVLTAITPSGKIASLTVQLQAKAVPTVITGTSNFVKAYATGGQTALTDSNLVIDGQYGRAMTSLPSGYDVSISTSNPTNVSVAFDAAGTTAATAVGSGVYLDVLVAGLRQSRPNSPMVERL